MRKYKRITAYVLTLLSFTVVVRYFIYYLIQVGYLNKLIVRHLIRKDVAIIGSADGPTSILISESQPPAIAILMISILISIVGIIYLIRTRNSSRKQKE